MKKKIFMIVSLSAVLIAGGIVLIAKTRKNNVPLARNYVIASAEGDVSYPFDLPFDKNTPIGQIASMYQSSYSHIYHKENGKWKEMDPTQRVNEDIHIKITR